MKKLLILFLLLTLIVSCTPTSPASIEQPASTLEPRSWWQDAIFYEIFVRSYKDSDGDGIGDFNGITQKLDYLQSLGINAIWLMPINPSPSYHGYDATNYYTVHPEYGSLEDFQNLLNEAHNRDIKIIIDLVLNHTSNEHPWFMDANGNPDSPYRDFYLWADSYPGYNGPVGVAWHAAKNGGYYYGMFSSSQPDLNYTNPDVTAEMYEITRYWLEDIGVDGFRVDAARNLIEEGQKAADTPSTHAWLADFYQFYKGINPDAYTVDEVVSASATLAKTYEGQGDQAFIFELASGMVNSANGESNTGIISAFKFTLKDKPDGNYATFLTNHDQDRVMSVLAGKVDKAKVAASMLFTAPGTPYIYYGEEIGMQGRKPDPDIRRPMQWSDAPNAGFTTAPLAWRNPDANYTEVNVAIEDTDPNSLLNHYRALIALRKAHSALRGGSITLLEISTTGAYAILRSDQTETMMVIINLTDSPITDYTLSLKTSYLADGTYTLETVFGDGQPVPLTVADNAISAYQPLAELAPYSTYVLTLK